MIKIYPLFLILVFLSPTFVFAQNADSIKNDLPVDARSQPLRQGTPVEQAARGEIPFSFTDESLQPDMRKIRRLPPTSLPEQSTQQGKAQQIGVTRELEPSLRLTTDSAAFNVDGGKVYLLGVISEGAKSIRVRFSQTKLPAGARIFVFPLENKNEFYGPFGKTSPLDDGTFWTPPVLGDGIVVEVFIPSDLENSINDYFQIKEIAHNFVGNEKCSSLLPGNCHNDVGPGYASMAAAVGYLEFMTSQGSFICTGTLMNTASVNFTPFLLTANHCFSTAASAQSLRVYWNYNTGDFPPGGTPFTDGATLLSTSTQSDFNFVKLTGSVPGGLTYSGWDGGDPAANSLIVGIHHPAGSHKRISFGFTNAIGSTCPPQLPSACGNFIPISWSSGMTEGGSSGSGLFYTASNGGRFTGNLWGGSEDCSIQNTSYYGRFSLTYGKVSSYLADGNCTYGVSPVSGSFTNAGGSGSFSVTTNGACYQSPVIIQPNTVQTFTNPASITVADRPDSSLPPGLGSIYPSTINISGLSGFVTRVRVRLKNITHTFPDDLDFLLVGPGGQTQLLMSDAGDLFDLNNTTLTIDQSGQTLLSDASSISSGTYRPSNYASLNIAESTGSDNFPSPAPGQNTYDNSLGVFYGTNPNGVWKLYVVDDEHQDTGTINGGWDLELATSGTSWITINSGVGYGNNTVNYSVAPNPPGQPARTGAIDVAGQPFIVFQNAGATTSTPARFDYDGDRKADVSVFRPSNGVWYIQNSSNGSFSINQWGLGSDLIVPADFDGDSKTDMAVWRPSTGVWFWINSSNGTVGGNQFGTTGDKPIPGDFDGDGKADITIFRPSTGAWWSLRSSNGSVTVQQFGLSEDKPVIGDFDGDAKSDLAVFRPSNGTWYRVNSSTGALIIVGFGLGEDKPVAADYDGDSKTDIAIFRPSNGAWYWINSSNGAVGGVLFGLSEDKPTPGDYDGDGKSDPAVFRPSQSTWYLLRSTMGFTAQQFGVTGDSPTPNSFIQ